MLDSLVSSFERELTRLDEIVGMSFLSEVGRDVVSLLPSIGGRPAYNITKDQIEQLRETGMNWCSIAELAFLTADIFASFGVLPLLHLRAYTLQDATVYTRSYLYSGNFIISTVKSRYSHCFNCLKLFNEDRKYPKNG